jgi:hypothetical protein
MAKWRVLCAIAYLDSVAVAWLITDGEWIATAQRFPRGIVIDPFARWEK